MKNLPRVLKYLRPYGHLGALVIALIVLASCTDLLGPWPLKVLVDNVLGSEPLPPWLAGMFSPDHGKMALLLAVVLAGLLVSLTHNLLAVANEYVQTMLEQKIVLDFRSELFQHAQRLSLAYHDNRRSGMLIYAINFQGDAIAGLIMTFPALGQSLITLVGMFCIVLHIDAVLAVMSLAVVPFLLYSVRHYSTHIQDRLMKVKGLEGHSLSIVHEAVSMLRVIVAFCREPHEYQRFRKQSEEAVAARLNVTLRQTLFSLVVNMTTAIGTAGVLGFGAWQVLEGRLTVGDLLVVMAYIAAVYKPLESITYTLGALQNKFVSQRIAFNILDKQPDVKESPHAKRLDGVAGRVEFCGVSFAYQGRSQTLCEISFDVAPGQSVAIVGPTGAGKTTLASLMPRFYDPQHGRILIDGTDIRDASIKSLRENISIVLQEPLLFSGTIADNIRYGRLDASDDQIVEAARAANAHDFIARLPNQYATELGERGAKLSGGERQRICIARAFLKRAPLLILDEPTSSVDSRTEAVILEALGRLMVGRTSFTIAHRLSTIHRADLILTLDQGRLVEWGEHSQLMARNGLYKELYDMQNAGRILRGAASGS